MGEIGGDDGIRTSTEDTAIRSSASARHWIKPALCGAAMAASAWLAAVSAGTAMNAVRYRSWESAPGVILLSEVAACEGGSFAAKVRYRFDVGGAVALGDRIAPGGPPCGSRASADREAGRWKVDRRVIVRYEPSAPRNSLLETGPEPAGPVAELALAALAFAFAAYLLLAPTLRARFARLRRAR